MAANKHAYRAVIGHRGILPGTEFASRMQAKKAGLTKEQQRGISWGLDEDDQRVADAIVLNKGYEDDHDTWDFVLYTGAGGRNAETERQEADQSWTYEDNEAVKRSFERKYFLRVLRGYKGSRTYRQRLGTGTTDSTKSRVVQMEWATQGFEYAKLRCVDVTSPCKNLLLWKCSCTR